MSFEESMTAFYMAMAENKLDDVCAALRGMRLAVQPGERASDPAANSEAAVREEMLRACEQKAVSCQEAALARLKETCTAGDDIDLVLGAFYVCVELGNAPARAAAPRLTGFMSRTFKARARAVMDRVRAEKGSAPVNEHGYIERHFYVAAMSEILTGATDMMNAVADAHAEAEVLQRVVQPLHDVCASVILEIVHMYIADARMSAWERRALAQARRDPNEPGEVESDESLQMVDLVLDELSFIIRILVSYSAFVRTMDVGAQAGVNTAAVAGGGGGGGGGQSNDSSHADTLALKIQELSGVYLVLERFYVFQSVHKATEIAEVQELESNVYVSSSVEDVSFVVNKSFFRASQCMNYHTALSIVIAIVDVLESTYLPSIVSLPTRPFVMPMPSESAENTPPGSHANGGIADQSNEVSFSDILLQAVDDDLTRSVQEESKLIMAINSSFVSGEFVANLESKIEALSLASFPQDAPILDCLPKHISELKDTFRSIVDNEIQEVLSRGIRKHMEPLINRTMMERIEYELTSSQYDTFGVTGSPLNQLIDQDVMKNKVLRRYQRALCHTPFESLVDCLVRDLTKWLEAALVRFRKRCNELGALQLEREITAMLTRVSELVSDTSLRAAFTRLFQVVLILNLMQPTEILDYADSLLQELTPSEIETFLRMRVEFTADSVSRAMMQLRAMPCATGGR